MTATTSNKFGGNPQLDISLDPSALYLNGIFKAIQIQSPGESKKAKVVSQIQTIMTRK